MQVIFEKKQPILIPVPERIGCQNGEQKEKTVLQNICIITYYFKQYNTKYSSAISSSIVPIFIPDSTH